MEKLTVTLEIILDPDVIEEELSEGWTQDRILESIEKHIRSAIGNQNVPGWKYIQDIEITSVGVS